MTSTRVTRCGILVLALPALSAFLNEPVRGGERCVTNASSSIEICVEWDGGTPVPTTDFAVDYTDVNYPDVELRSGGAWSVWSQDKTNGSLVTDIGQITIEPSASENYTVEIAEGSGAGADDVKGIDLTEGGWTGHSSITGGTVAGTLEGDLKVKASGGNGGSVTLTIEGDLTASYRRTDADMSMCECANVRMSSIKCRITNNE